jgi:hypothetical protein
MFTPLANRTSETLRHDVFDPPEQTDRPICANSGWPMWINLANPHKPDKNTSKWEHREFALAA